MRKLRIVLDTNILVSALGWEGNERKTLLKVINGEIELVGSQELLDELKEVLNRSKFDYIAEIKKSELLNTLIEYSQITIPKEKLDIIKDDTKDNKVLEAAVEGRADYIVSGDEHLLKLKEFKGINIVNAQEFLRIIKKN